MHESAAPASLAAAHRARRRTRRTARGAHAVTKEPRAAGWHLAARATRRRALQPDGPAGRLFFQSDAARPSEPPVLRVQQLPGYLPDHPGDDPERGARLAAARAAGAVRDDRPGARHAGDAGGLPARLWRPRGWPLRERGRAGAAGAEPRRARRAPRRHPRRLPHRSHRHALSDRRPGAHGRRIHAAPHRRGLEGRPRHAGAGLDPVSGKTRIGERLFVTLQRALPQHTLSRLIRALARAGWLRRPLIAVFLRAYRPDLQDAAEPDPRRYSSFNAFFTRALREGARPLADPALAIVSPVDGTISALGRIEAGRLLQAKGHDYSLPPPLAGDEVLAAPLRDGSFITIHLAP